MGRRGGGSLRLTLSSSLRETFRAQHVQSGKNCHSRRALKWHLRQALAEMRVYTRVRVTSCGYKMGRQKEWAASAGASTQRRAHTARRAYQYHACPATPTHDAPARQWASK